MRVPWHRSLFVRLFLLGAITALVAVAAATWATARSTTVAVQEQQQQSLEDEAATYDALMGYAASHPSWDGAQRLVDRLARESGQPVIVTDRTGRVRVRSKGAPARALPPSSARAVIDPLDVDVALLSSASPTATATPTPEPASVPASGDGRCSDPDVAAECGRYEVPARSAVDPRASRAIVDRGREGWTAVVDGADSCLAAAGLEPLLALTDDFTALVPYRTSDTTVARCVDSSVREVLSTTVAPPALLMTGTASAPPSVLWDLSGPAQRRIGLLAALVLVVTLALSALLAGHLVRPLRSMAGAARRAGDGDLSARVPADRRADEVGELARAFNTMAARREQSEDARRRLVSDVSHELRTPIANVRGWLEAAQDGLATLDRQLIDSLHEETLHLQRLADDLHDLALAEAGELRLSPVTIDLAEMLGQVAASFPSPRLTVVCDAGATIAADPVRMRQVVLNLLANALRHTPDDGSVTLAGGPGTITVTDTGEGIPADDLPHVFDRFRRVDPSRTRATGGTGLGLAIVKQIVDAHGGDVSIASVVGEGTTVTVRLPDRRDD
ncbi:MAG: HAMP domain-containing sensor histidine kinase [Aeromicrobium sp.]